MAKYAPPNPSGLCMCGCGRTTRIHTADTRGPNRVRGEHLRVLRGHKVALNIVTERPLDVPGHAITTVILRCKTTRVEHGPRELAAAACRVLSATPDERREALVDLAALCVAWADA